jgi:hypothetical protein
MFQYSEFIEKKCELNRRKVIINSQKVGTLNPIFWLETSAPVMKAFNRWLIYDLPMFPITPSQCSAFIYLIKGKI